MTGEKWSPQPYAWEEVISFDRLRRAVQGRVVKRLEAMMETEPVVDPVQIAEYTREEWGRAKDAVRSSPQAREAYRKWLEGEVLSQVSEHLTKDKATLEAHGVAEKGL